MYVCPSACESACVNDNRIHFSVHPGDLSEFVLLKQKTLMIESIYEKLKDFVVGES